MHNIFYQGDPGHSRPTLKIKKIILIRDESTLETRSGAWFNHLIQSGEHEFQHKFYNIDLRRAQAEGNKAALLMLLTTLSIHLEKNWLYVVVHCSS